MDIRLWILVIGYIFMLITNLSLGIFLLWKNRKSIINLTFALVCFSIVLWSSFWILAFLTKDAEAARWLFAIGILLGGGTSVFLSHFTLAFIKKNQGKKKELIAIYILSILVFFSCLIFFDHFIGIRPTMYLKYYPQCRILHIPYMIFLFGVGFYSIYHLVKAYIRSKDYQERNRIKYLFTAFIIGYTGASFCMPLCYGLKIDVLPSVLAGVYPLLIFYAIIKHHLLDINVVIKKTLIYSVIIALIAGLMVAVSFLSNWFMQNIPGFQFWMAPLIAGITAFIIGNLFWKKSKEADNLKYEFIRVAAHKLRTPITHVKWATEGLLEIVKTEEEKKLISQINNANEQLIKLANALLNASQVEYKDLYKLSPVNLEEIGREILLSFQIQINTKKIEIIFNADKNLPKINTDEEKIGAVIQTLLANAIMYTPKEGEIRIFIEKQKDNLVFSVKDSGIGIIKEEQPYIFSRFFRSHRAESIQTEGLGLGLFLVKNIVERLGGKIWFDSEGENKGARFWFSLPLETL